MMVFKEFTRGRAGTPGRTHAAHDVHWQRLGPLAR